ncbi:Lrp/AsnC family transcriptional regulator [Microbacterium barkeri]|nr:Lrp/AsnC family transcriptional regulator [Microbacterium barkeri]MDI6943401.1 Lrp/AsnC family transcriptional regulator [Microbacterium barkeri]MDR6878208.1 DNA-binding Lrp family transcriptional regulator [Microbacterium barkeri]
MTGAIEVPSMSESDLDLIDALLVAPRAPWASVARMLGTSAPTARRRWSRLVESDRAWVTSYVGHPAGIVSGYVEIRCQPGSVDATASEISAHPRVLSIVGVTGDRDLVLSVVAEDMRGFRSVIQHEIGAHPKIVHARTALVSRLFRDGSSWRTRGSAPAKPFDVERDAPPGRDARERATLRTVLRVLERDGRATSSELAAALQTSEAQARRTVGRLLRTGQIIQSVDVARSVAHYAHALLLWLVVPAARIEESARLVSALPFVRLCAAIAGGPSNLYVIVWARSLSEAADLEAQLMQRVEGRVADRSIVLHHYKRFGHCFDDDERRVAHVAWSAG